MRDQLVRLEPEVTTLLATAEQLFVNPTAIEREGICSPGPSDQDVFVGEESATIIDRISTVNHQLKALIKVCDAYIRHLSAFIRDSGADGDRGESPMLSLSEEVTYITTFFLFFYYSICSISLSLHKLFGITLYDYYLLPTLFTQLLRSAHLFNKVESGTKNLLLFTFVLV